MADDPSKIVKFTGHLVNDSAVRVDMISQDGKQPTTESMIAVRLNTSQLLHTRILWRPTLLNEMQVINLIMLQANFSCKNLVNSSVYFIHFPAMNMFRHSVILL